MSRVLSPAHVLLSCAASVVATHLVLAQDTGRTASVPSNEPDDSCRTFDSSGTAVSVTGASKVTTRFSGLYDPWAKRTTQQITYTDGRGLSLTFTQVTTYASTDDVMAEVVRLKEPAGPSTNPPGRQTLVVPPLSRFLQMTASGAVGFTLTNSHDANGRLTGSMHVQPAGRTITRYTAWDTSGRPTAGVRQAIAQSSQIVITYDDAARSSTTTTTTGSTVVVGTQTYDANGNPRVYTQRSNLDATVSTTTTTPASSATVCLGDLRVPVAPSIAPVGPAPNGTFTATVNGRSWNALGVNGQYAKSSQNPIVSVAGRDDQYAISVAFAASPGPGQYTAGLMDAAKVATTTQAQFAQMIQRNTVVASVLDSKTQAGWQADPSHGSGTLTVASVSPAGASGTFSLTLAPTSGTSASGAITLSGSFNVKF